MADNTNKQGHPSRPGHSRSSSISKTSRTTHQRKPSSSAHLYAIPEQQKKKQQEQDSVPLTTPSPSSSASLNSTHFHSPASSSPSLGLKNSEYPEMYPPSPKRRVQPAWKRHLSTAMRHVDALMDSPSGPLLPHDKHSPAFGGTQRRSRLATVFRSRPFRFLILFYIIFSVFLSVNHLWNWLFTPHLFLDARFGDQWVPQRTYDQDETYSSLDEMTHGLKMSKLFSKAFYDAAGSAKPYWLASHTLPREDDISLLTSVTPGTWSELERLAQHWQGPISATVHVQTGDSAALAQIQSAWQSKLADRVDVHLVQTPGSAVTVLMPRNAERNMARLFARTEFVMEMPSHMIPATDLRRTLDTNRQIFDTLLRSGDMLVVPVFGFASYDSSAYIMPRQKSRVVELVEENQLGLLDPHWKLNEGPTSYDHWYNATTLYPVEHYDFHYEPIVIESKHVQPWCAERFLNRRSACMFSSYLAGGEFWVLPDDFIVQMPENKEYVISDFDHVIENRLYAKFYWEQCVHHARQLDALQLWKTPRSEHVRKQCSRVIQNWGKGLIGKPE